MKLDYILETYDAGYIKRWYRDIVLTSSFQSKANIKLPLTPNLLGIGTAGAAFDIGSGKVLKITSDELEARASSLIAKKSLRGVWKVFGVYKYKPMSARHLIVGEKLKPIGGRGMALLSALNSAVKGKIFFKSSTYKNTELGDILETLKGLTEKFPNSTINDAIEIAYGMNALINLGIQFNDLHVGNIMLRGDKPVIIDLGFSQSGVGPISVFENEIASIDEGVLDWVETIKANVYATYHHRGQTRKSSNLSYITHPRRVANRLRKFGIKDADILAASLLHDTIEDTKVSKADIIRHFNQRVANIVDWVTTKGDKVSYIARLMANGPEPAILIKVFDRIDNLLDNPNKEKARDSTDVIKQGLEKRGMTSLYNEFMKTYTKVYGTNK
jgi:hypothetical protein